MHCGMPEAVDRYEEQKDVRIGKEELHEGDYISLDGNTGKIYPGKVQFGIEKPKQLLSKVKQWIQQKQKKTL